MADINKTVEVIFNAVDQTRGGIDSAVKNFNDLDSSIQGMAGPAAELTRSLLAVELAVIGAGTAITTLSVATAGDYQTAVSEVGTLLNLNTQQNSDFAQSLIDYSRNASVALDDIVSSSYIAISTGTDLADVTTTLSASEQLAVASAADLQVATGALSRTLNAYGLSAEDAERVSNALFIAVQNGDTTMDQLGSTIGRVASIASASSVSVEELLASIAGITVSGVETSQAVTGLVALFKEFASPTDALTDALGGMNLETNSLQEMMQRLQEATGGSFAEFNKLFGSIEATNAATILANDSTGAFATTLQAMESETNNLAQAYSVMEGTFDRVNQNLVNNLKATLIEAGTPLLDEYAQSVSNLGDVFEALSAGMDTTSFQQVNTALEGFIGRFNEALAGIADALPEAMGRVDFAGLIDSFEGLGEAVGEAFDELFGDDLDLTKPEDLAEVLQKAVNGISALTDATTGVVDSFKPVFGAIGEILEQFNGLSSDQQEFAGKIGGSALLLDGLGTILGGLAITIRETGASIQDVANTIAGAAGVAFNTIQILFDGYIQYTAAAVSSISGILAGLPDFLGGDKFEKEAEEFRLIAEAAAASFDKNVEDFIDSAKLMNSGISGEASQAAKALEKVPDAASDAAEKTESSSKVVAGSLAFIKESAEAAGVSLVDYMDALANTEGASPDVALSAEQVAEALGKTGDGAEIASGSLEKAKDELLKYEVVIDEFGNKTLVATDAMQDFSKGVDSTGDSSDQSAQKVESLKDKMLELASDERIAAMEFTASIETARIEADAQRVEAVMESIGASVEATAQATTDMYSLLASPELSLRDKMQISSAADEQLKLQKEALKMQKEATQAEVAYMKERTKMLQEGGGAININAENLAPELQLVLKSLIDNIRTEAIEQGLEILM